MVNVRVRLLCRLGTSGLLNLVLHMSTSKTSSIHNFIDLNLLLVPSRFAQDPRNSWYLWKANSTTCIQKIIDCLDWIQATPKSAHLPWNQLSRQTIARYTGSMQILWPYGDFEYLLYLLLLRFCRHFLYQVSALIIPICCMLFMDNIYP